MNILYIFLIIIGGITIVRGLVTQLKMVWLTRGELFNSVCVLVDKMAGYKGAADPIKKFCKPMLPKEEVKEIIKEDDKE